MAKIGVPSPHKSGLYIGPQTFMNVPYSTNFSDAQAVILGVPYDGGLHPTRIGSRAGPASIREHSQLVRPFQPPQATFNPLELLGLVDYKYVQYFMRNCISAINPSFFEGWSSTVEESKSIGKRIILSDLEIHREQDPPGAIFFDPHNAEELAKIMAEIWKTKDGGPDLEKEKDAKVKLEGRIKKFGEEYQNSIENLFN